MEVLTINVARAPEVVAIGNARENIASEIAFDYSPWVKRFGEGTCYLHVQRPQDANPYEAVLEEDETSGRVIWRPTNADTDFTGRGRAQFVFRYGEVEARSVTFYITSAVSLDATGDPPDPWETWMDALEDLADETTLNAREARSAANAAGTSATGAQRSATDAESAKTNAVAASEAAAASASHYPQIVGGVWYVWSPTAGEYISTGIDAQGEDGVSPTVEITAIQGGHRVVITDAAGPHTFDVTDGATPDLSAYRTASEQDEIDDAQDEELNNLKSALGQVGYYIPPLVLGNIVINAQGVPTYQVRNYGVITPQGSFCKFTKGTVLSLSDYSNAQFATGIKISDNKLGNSGWITSGSYTIQETGEYILNIQSKPTTAQESIDALLSLLVINNASVSNQLETILTEITRNNFSQNGFKTIGTISSSWPQGVCCVGDKVLCFYASNDAHTNTANVLVYGIADLTTEIARFAHNTGHAASADYAPDTDTLLISNGNNPAPTPIVYMVGKYASKLESLTNIVYDATDVSQLNLSALTNQSIVACFGETGDIVYVVTAPDSYDSDYVKTIYKLQIGYGTNQFADVGTYAYIDDDSPNGTAKIIAQYKVSFPGELQGLKFNGKLLIPCDTRKGFFATKTAFIVSVSMDGLNAKIDKTVWVPLINKNGGLPGYEVEDILLHDYRAFIPAPVASKIYVFNASELN